MNIKKLKNIKVLAIINQTLDLSAANITPTNPNRNVSKINGLAMSKKMFGTHKSKETIKHMRAISLNLSID